MYQSVSNASRRSFRTSGASAVRRATAHALLRAVGAIALGILGAVTIGAGIAAAAPPPAPAPTPSPAVVAEVAISEPLASEFLGMNSFTVRGTKDADGTVTVTAASSGGAEKPVCATTTETPDGLGWSCTAQNVPNGKNVTLTAKQRMYDDGSSTAPARVVVNVLGPPSLDGAGSFVTPGIVSGGAVSGNVVTVMVTNPNATGCTSGVVNGYWSCSVGAPSGTYTVTAYQSWSAGATNHSGKSNPQRVTVDKNRPPPPVVTSPRADSRVTTRTVRFTGTGEPRGFVNVYIDASPVCGAGTASSGAWSCSASGIARGAHAVQAIQSDQAGNFSDPSAPLRVYFGAKKDAAVPPKSSQGTPSPTPAPSTTPSPTPSPSTIPPSAPHHPDPGAPPPAQGGSGSNWGTPTDFGGHLASLSTTWTSGSWLLAPLLAAGFILLIALPLRLAASTLRGRVRLPRARLFGRNQVEAPDDTPPPNPWLAGAIPLAAAAGIIVIAEGFNGEVRYLRLLAAAGFGLAILNVVGVAIATRASATLLRVGSRLRFMPSLLIAATAIALVSRWGGIEPLLVAGVLIGARFTLTSAARARGIVNLAEIGVITLLAVIAWLCHEWMMPAAGFWANLSVETLATVCLAGLGSACVLMLPVGPLPGRVILEWSPLAWLIATAAVATLSWVILLGGGAATFPVLGAFMVAGGFAAIAVAVWTWVRYVEPASL